MNQASPKKLRSELKDYLDMASSEPVRIQRRSGESLILMSEEKYSEMQNEILSLQRRLLSSSQIISGETKEYTPGDRSRLSRFKK
jgi:PHD/YefM family antitoxin component YafN of YafNO toxin-antitoxin module